MEFRSGDDVVAPTPTSSFPTEDALPAPIRTGFSNDHHEHFPSRQDDDNDEEFQRPLVTTETFYQESESNHCLGECMRDCCVCCLLPFITAIALISFFFSVILSMDTTFKLGQHASLLIDQSPNPLWKEFVKVERRYDDTGEPERPNDIYDDTPLLDIETSWSSSSPMLFGFENPPPLSVETSWSEKHNATLHGYARKLRSKVDWKYYLNEGSKIDISYNVSSSLIPAQVYLVIKEVGGSSYWSRNLLDTQINGTGVEIGHNIPESSTYSVSLYNTRLDIAEVELEINIKGLVYDYSKAFYNCSINKGPCFMRIPFMTGANPALLAFPDPGNGNEDEAHLLLSYEPRWIVWLIFIGGPLVVMAYLSTLHYPSINRPPRTLQGENFHLDNITCPTTQGEGSFQENIEPQGESLIPQKADDNTASSNGPSTGSHNGNVTSDHEYDSNNKHLCAICFNAPRDSLFLPCGHSVSCYACGSKIAKVTGICSICRRPMKVKMIYFDGT